MVKDKAQCDFQKIIQLVDEYIAARLAYFENVSGIVNIGPARRRLDAHIDYLKKTYTKKLGPGCR